MVGTGRQATCAHPDRGIRRLPRYGGEGLVDEVRERFDADVEHLFIER
jgi:hypothetical protein